MAKFCQLLLACKDMPEANTIARSLLEKNIIACAKYLPTTSDFLWQGKVENNNEILLMMDSREDLFDEAQAEIAKMHSYDTFVLQAIPVLQTSSKAKSWLVGSLAE